LEIQTNFTIGGVAKIPHN